MTALTDVEQQTAFTHLTWMADSYRNLNGEDIDTMRVGDNVIDALGVKPVLDWGREHHVTVLRTDNKLLCRRLVLAPSLRWARDDARDRGWGRQDRDWWYVSEPNRQMNGLPDPVEIVLLGAPRSGMIAEARAIARFINSRWKDFPYATAQAR